MPVAEVCRIGLLMAKGLASLHSAGVMHLDVKPLNVLLTEDGDAVLADFGISQYIHSTLTAWRPSQAMYGTSNYMCAATCMRLSRPPSMPCARKTLS